MREETKPLTLHPAFQQKTVHILVRWLIIALAFHFIALSGVRTEEFSLAVQISSVFIASNLLLMIVPRRQFSPGRFFRGLIAFDLAFVAVCLYFLREPGAYYHWIYILLLGLLLWRRDVREVLATLAAGLVLSGLATLVLQGEWRISSDTGDFLRISILFAIGVFYFFVVELLDGNARLFHIVARAKQEWERTADAMSELILLVDGEGRIQRVNRALADHLGQKPAELVGQLWHSVLDGSEAPPWESPLLQMARVRKPVQERHTHAKLRCVTETTAIPLFEGEALAGAIYVLRPLKE
ncbi:MAG: hypothetical protein A3J28_18975 [Acidobacteria bacterium RIFCSPLOWO2_12_FULL_60_22]|nr:MAG: hypothetical protein A3J28_18975 [Acidobacteria bacterium RIFCSPLOWO2_12_FULL_60_22]